MCTVRYVSKALLIIIIMLLYLLCRYMQCMLSMQQMKSLSCDVETPEDIIKSCKVDTFSFTALCY